MLTNAVYFESSFAENENVVAVQSYADNWSISHESDVVLLDRVELSVHEETYVVHEKDDLIRSGYFEEWTFALKRSFDHRKGFFDQVGFVIFLVRAYDMSSIETDISGQLAEPKFFRLFQLLCTGVHVDKIAFFLLGNHCDSLESTFLVTLIYAEVMDLNKPYCTF
jgi:hypothetical protein